MQAMMARTKHELEDVLPFAMEPVVYDFAINERGTWAELLDTGTRRNGDVGRGTGDTGRGTRRHGDTGQGIRECRRVAAAAHAGWLLRLDVPDLVRLDRRQLLPARRRWS